MSKRAAKFVSTIFAGIFAGAPLATVSHGAPETADSCLSRPKGLLPSGGHWYYRIDRATKRPCWYIGDEKQKTSRTAPEASQPAANSVPPRSSAGTQRSIADARAELPIPQARVESEKSVFAAQPTAATAVGTASPENDQRANTRDAGVRNSVVASRWPEPSGATSPASPQASENNSASQPQQISEAAAPPAAAAVTLAAADASLVRPTGTIQLLLIAIAGALALAGLIASAVFRFGGWRPTGWRDIRVDRRANRDSGRPDRPSLSDEARAAISMRDLDPPRAPHAADDPNERIAQMLDRLARSAAT